MSREPPSIIRSNAGREKGTFCADGGEITAGATGTVSVTGTGGGGWAKAGG